MVMRGILSLGFGIVLVACSSAGPTNQNPDPQKPKEPDPVPVYPTADYPQGTGTGFQVGQVAEDFTWEAFLPNAPQGQLAKVSMHDFFDPDGARGINALVIVTSAEWCPACMTESQALEGKIKAKWGAMGVQVMELMIEDKTQNKSLPAVTTAAENWRTKYNFTDVAIGLDPTFHFKKSGTNGLPVNVIIDPRTMTTVQRFDGASNSVDTQIANLVAKNKL